VRVATRPVAGARSTTENRRIAVGTVGSLFGGRLDQDRLLHVNDSNVHLATRTRESSRFSEKTK